MYVSRSEVTIPEGQQPAFLSQTESQHTSMRTAQGFRWAMLLRSIEDPAILASVAMWLTREQAGVADFPVQHYDVATARGSMTPAAVVAIVDWQVDPATAPSFVNRWNAAFHAIEDMLGSRLLQDLDKPTHYAGLHVATSDALMKQDMLESAIEESGGSDLKPLTVTRYEVVHLAEA